MIVQRSSAVRRIAACACAVAFLAGCTKVASDGGTSPSGSGPSASSASGGNAFTHHHELRIAQQGDIEGLNSLLDQELTAAWPEELVLAYLLRYDHDNHVTPELATVVPTQQNGGISADGKTITYHLRKGVKWSDGAPFTAADVAFSTKIINDPKTNVQSRQGWDQIVRLDTPDPLTVVFHLKSVFSPFVDLTFTSGGQGPPVLPKHLLEHSANINTDPYNSLPVGIGPFKFVEWARADHISLVANPLYWRGKPKLERIVFKIIPNRDTILAEQQTGEIDIWPLVPPAYYTRSVAAKGFTMLRNAGYGFGHLDFNVSHPVLSDPIVRRALLLAWDRRAQRTKIGHGIGILQDSVFPAKSPFFDPKIGFTELDAAKANALLDGAGWKRGADGVRAKNGVRLNLELVSNSGSPDTDSRIELLRQDWKAIGVTFVRKNYDPNLLLASFQEGGIIQTGKFDVSFSAWYAPPTGDYSNLYSCKQIPPHGQNDLRWCDRTAEAAMDDFLGTFDQARRKRDAITLQDRMFAGTPTALSVLYEDLFAVNADVKGFHPNSVSFFDDMMNVDI